MWGAQNPAVPTSRSPADPQRPWRRVVWVYPEDHARYQELPEFWNWAIPLGLDESQDREQVQKSLDFEIPHCSEKLRQVINTLADPNYR